MFEETIMDARETHRRRIGVVSTVGALLLCFMCWPAVGDDSAAGAGGVVRRRAVEVPNADWSKYCASLSMNGVADGEMTISRDTASRFQLLWSRKLNGPIGSAPSIAHGKVYVGDWGGFEWALDAVTGDVIASVDLGRTSQ